MCAFKGGKSDCKAPRQAVVLAAGYGKRLRHLSSGLPKPLVKVNGRCLIDCVILWLLEGGIQEIHVNLHWYGYMIRNYLEQTFPKCKINYYEEIEKPLGTGGGIQQMLPQLGEEPFVVVNSDVIMLEPLSSINAAYISRDCPAPLIVVDNRFNSIGFGKVGIHKGRVYRLLTTTINERQNAESVSFCGVSILKASLWSGVRQQTGAEQCLICDVMCPWLLAGYPLFAHITTRERFDVGTPEQLREAELFLSRLSSIEKD